MGFQETLPLEPTLSQVPSPRSRHRSFPHLTSFQLLVTSLGSKLRDTLTLQFVYSFKTHLWHKIHGLISFPLIWSVKPQPSPLGTLQYYFKIQEAPGQASHRAFIFILPTHIPPLDSTRWFILHSCLQDTAGHCHGPDTGNAYKPASFSSDWSYLEVHLQETRNSSSSLTLSCGAHAHQVTQHRNSCAAPGH